MDKFRKIVTDPYYAGVIEINKQVKVYNKNGLHESLISYEEHLRLVKIMDSKPKYQIGPKRNGNPMFPLSNLLEDDSCLDQKDRGRLVGVPLTNGKSPKIYKKYRCRTCRHAWTQEAMHEKIVELFQKYEMSTDAQRKIIKALDIVWKNDSEKRLENIYAARKSIAATKDQIRQQVENATNPANEAIKDDILDIIKDRKAHLS